MPPTRQARFYRRRFPDNFYLTDPALHLPDDKLKPASRLLGIWAVMTQVPVWEHYASASVTGVLVDPGHRVVESLGELLDADAGLGVDRPKPFAP